MVETQTVEEWLGELSRHLHALNHSKGVSWLVCREHSCESSRRFVGIETNTHHLGGGEDYPPGLTPSTETIVSAEVKLDPLSWFHSHPDPLIQRMSSLMDEQVQIWYDRAQERGTTSWADEGIDGLMFHIISRVRRLWQVVMIDQKVPNSDYINDLGNYGRMLQSLAEIHPESLEKMRVKGIRGAFGESYTGVSEQ